MGIEGRFAAAAAPSVPIVSFEVPPWVRPLSIRGRSPMMHQSRMTVGGVAVALLLWGAVGRVQQYSRPR